MTYREKLKLPEWDRKRRKILRRDNYRCTACGRNDMRLHVHHKTYRWRTNPWDYADCELETLCESCHESETFGYPYMLFNVLSPLDAFDSGVVAAHVLERVADWAERRGDTGGEIVEFLDRITDGANGTSALDDLWLKFYQDRHTENKVRHDR